MKTYIGIKIIEAEPMNLGDYNKFRGWAIPKNEDPSREGYLVKYPPDGYISWSPKEVFEDAYFAIEKSIAEKACEQFRHSIFGISNN